MNTPPQSIAYYPDICPETSLRLVDQELTNWLSGLRFRNQTPTVTNVWQSRQFAQNHEMKNGQPPKQAKVWPVVSLSMTGLVPALDRRVVGEIYRLGMAGTPLPNELLSTGDGTTGNYEGRLAHFPVSPGTVTVTAGAQVLRDDGDGGWTGDLGSGPSDLDYSTGKFRISFASLVGAGVVVQAAYTTTDTRMYVDTERTESYTLPFPLPYDLTYQVDLWTKTQQDMQALRTSLLCRFPMTDVTYLDLPVPGYGTQMIMLTLNRIDDNTDLDPGEGDRELRNTVTLTAHAWIYRIALRRKTIRSVNTVFIDAGSDPANLGEGSDFLKWYLDNTHYNFGVSPDPSGVLSSVTESPAFAPPARAIAWLSWVDGSMVKVGP